MNASLEYSISKPLVYESKRIQLTSQTLHTAVSQLSPFEYLATGKGSVFQVKPDGKLADVTPEKFKNHRVYRSGISLSLPIKVRK
ncbi:MAG: hypothetical protein WBA93_07365 [Microcoleaceae cyanobacterium]